VIFLTKVKQLSQTTSHRLSRYLCEHALQSLNIHWALNWEGSFLSDGSFFFWVLAYEGIQSREEFFEVYSYQLVSIGADFFLELLLIDMKFLEASYDRIGGAGVMDLFQN
jgi:hypothetical protein